MKIVLISGLSGSGKSVALKQLEDLGYYCVDNLPLEMLPSLVLYHIERGEETQLGVSVDIRSGINIQEAQEQIQYLRNEGHQVEVLFVEAEEGVLVRRFSETRRGHPTPFRQRAQLLGECRQLCIFNINSAVLNSVPCFRFHEFRFQTDVRKTVFRRAIEVVQGSVGADQGVTRPGNNQVAGAA